VLWLWSRTAECNRLHFMAKAENAATRELLQRQRDKARALLADVASEVSAMPPPIAVPKLALGEVETLFFCI
jgi:hypothetical protein